MNLFIETPQQLAERLAREQRRQIEELRAAACAAGVAAGAPAAVPPCGGEAGYGVAVSGAPPAADVRGRWSSDPPAVSAGAGERRAPFAGEASVGAAPAVSPAANVADVGRDEYRAERAYLRKRDARARVLRILRVVAFLVLVPVVLVAVFVVAYLLTCILNGASPSDVVTLTGMMVDRAGSFLSELAAMF